MQHRNPCRNLQKNKRFRHGFLIKALFFRMMDFCCQIVVTRDFDRPETLILRGFPDFSLYSHSIEEGGLLVTSSTTRLAWATSLTMWEETVAMRS